VADGLAEIRDNAVHPTETGVAVLDRLAAMVA
jgi:hypothetical protein